MIAKNTNTNQLVQALNAVNNIYDDNIEFNRYPEWIGKQIRFTLRVKDSHGKGARLGFYQNPNTGNRRHLVSACWHVHGNFFEQLFKIAPDAEIIAGNKTITKNFGNWEDRNIGSMMSPLYFSEACEC